MTTVTAARSRSSARPGAARPPARPPAPPWPRRRLALSAHTPREVARPAGHADPVRARHRARAARRPCSGRGGVDYGPFVIVGTVGLLIPLTCVFAGIGVIVDRTSGARRELLAAPDPARPDRASATWPSPSAISLLQVGALIAAGWPAAATSTPPRPASPGSPAPCSRSPSCMYAVAEILANRIPTQEEYVGLRPRRSRSCPGSSPGRCSRSPRCPTLPASLAKALPLTHVLALMRYGVLDDSAGLHDIWGMNNPTAIGRAQPRGRESGLSRS